MTPVSCPSLPHAGEVRGFLEPNVLSRRTGGQDLARRELRKAYNRAYEMYQRTRSHKWALELKRANLALMQLSMKEGRQ